MKKSTCLLSIALAFIYQGAQAEENRYIPLEGTPDQATKAWRFAGSKKAVNVEDSSLNVNLKDNDTLFWSIGKKGDQEQGDYSAWNLNDTGLATITFKLKVDASDNNVNCFTIMACGNKGIATINFYPDQITAGPTGKKVYQHDTRQEDVYKLVIENGKYSLISKRGGDIFRNLEVSGENTWNLLWIGSTYPVGDEPNPNIKCERSWNLGFIKWSNQEANLDAPEGN